MGELGIQRQFAKKEHEAKKLSQAGFAQECREADIYDAAALGPACTEAYSPKALEWSVVGNRMGLPSMTDFETAFSDLNELQRRTRKALTDSLPEACVLITVLVINIWAAYHQVGVEALSAWSLLVVVVFTCALIATLGASVSYYHGLFIILSVAISSFYARQGQEPLNPVEWSLAFIGLVTNAFADLSANDHLVVILTAFANLATLAAMALGQTGSRLHAQQQLAKLFARYRPSNTAVRALVRTRFDYQLYAVVFRVIRRLGPIGFLSNIPVFLSVFLTLFIHLVGLYSFCATLLPDSIWRRFKDGEVSWSIFGPLHGGSKKLHREALSSGEGGNQARVSLVVLTMMLCLFPVTLVLLSLVVGVQRFNGVDWGESINVIQIKAQAESLVRAPRELNIGAWTCQPVRF